MAPTFTKVLVSCFLLVSSIFLLPGCDAQKTRDYYANEQKWAQERQQKKEARRQAELNIQYSGLNALIGKSKHELILQNGPPNRTTSDGAGGEVLVYSHGMTTGTFIYGMYVQNTSVQEIQIFCDPTGKIYTWRAN